MLAIGDGQKLTCGKPGIEGAEVIAIAQGHGLGDKVTVFHYKAKTRHSCKTGHRQGYTELLIDSIAAPGISEAPKSEPKPSRRTKKEVTESGT